MSRAVNVSLKRTSDPATFDHLNEDRQIAVPMKIRGRKARSGFVCLRVIQICPNSMPLREK
jgi:hypothetical protein